MIKRISVKTIRYLKLPLRDKWELLKDAHENSPAWYMVEMILAAVILATSLILFILYDRDRMANVMRDMKCEKVHYATDSFGDTRAYKSGCTFDMDSDDISDMNVTWQLQDMSCESITKDGDRYKYSNCSFNIEL